jgi:hypothetical protein
MHTLVVVVVVVVGGGGGGGGVRVGRLQTCVPLPLTVSSVRD